MTTPPLLLSELDVCIAAHDHQAVPADEIAISAGVSKALDQRITPCTQPGDVAPCAQSANSPALS